MEEVLKIAFAAEDIKKVVKSKDPASKKILFPIR
jgi:hypothetical protein